MFTGTVIVSGGLTSGFTPDLRHARRLARNALGKWTVSHLQSRVGTKGRGAFGKLAPYSTTPVKVREEDGLKKKQPPGGLPRFYKGGYREYRKKVGLTVNKFVFSNTGHSLRSMTHDIEGDGSTGAVLVFMSDAASMQAAEKAVDRGREDMFDANDRELETMTGEYLTALTSELWDDFFGT